jgi:hypothetical protein
VTEGARTGDDLDLADALAERALGRATAAGAVAGLAMGTLALLFVVMAGGDLDERSLPQLLVLGVCQVAGLVTAGRCVARLRAVRSAPGTGPGHAAGAAVMLRRLLVGTTALGAALGLLGVIVLRPIVTAGFSALLAVALLSQFVLVLEVQRRGLLRAAVRRLS